MSRLSTVLILLAACGGGAGVPTGDGLPDAAPPAPDAAEPDAASEVLCNDPSCSFDCNVIPAPPFAEKTVAGPRGWKGLAIDNEGFMSGSDESGAVILSDYAGDWSVLAPAVGNLEGMDFLSGGDLVVTSSNTETVTRISRKGGQEVLINDLYVYGLVLGPDELLYGGGLDGAYRIDPANGEYSLLVATPGWARTVNFSPEFDRLYIGMAGNGEIFYQELDGELEPVGDLQLLAYAGPAYIDGIAVDACGNLYVSELITSALHRVSPSGEVTPLMDWSDEAVEHLYPHDALFGNGVGGWRHDAIYAPMPYDNNKVKEIVVGVPGRKWKGTVTNAPSY